MQFFNRQGWMLSLMLTAVVVMLCEVSEVSAVEVDMSVGGGVVFSSNFGGGMMAERTFRDYDEWIATSTPHTAFGINAFVDIMYAEASIAIAFANGTWKAEYENSYSDGIKSGKGKISFTGLNLGLLAKYPIPLSNVMTFFPGAGFDYENCLSGKQKSDGEEVRWDGKNGRPEAGNFSRFWFKFGGVVDYTLSKQLYIRSELLYGIGLNNKDEEDTIKDMKDDYDDVGGQLSHGLTIKAGIGYKF